MSGKPSKYPVSALVTLHDGDGSILLIERMAPQGFQQSVTGSMEEGERIEETTWREVWKGTGIRLADEQPENWHGSAIYEIYHHWRHRYPKGVFKNREHTFSAQILRDTPIVLRPDEHAAYGWFGVEEAAEKVPSPSNKHAILELVKRLNAKKAV